MKKIGKKNWFVNILENVLNTIFWLFDAWHRLIETVERTLIGNIAASVPWAAPVPSAYMLFNHALKILVWDHWVAWVLAIAVEGLGVSIGSTAFDLWNWHDQKKNGRAALNVAFGMVAFYLVIVISVNVLLDLGMPVWIAKMGISMLSIPAIVTLALRSQHARRVEAAAADDAKRAEDEKKAAAILEQERELAFRREERAKEKEFKRQLRLKEIETNSDDGNSQKLSAKVTESVSEMPATFGKWKRWPAVPDEYKRHIALEIAKNKEKNAMSYKKLSADYLVREFGLDERGAYNWIGYAERDFSWLVEVNHDAVVVTEEFQSLKTEVQ